MATLAPQARASGENLNYVSLVPQARPSGEILNYSLSHNFDILVRSLVCLHTQVDTTFENLGKDFVFCIEQTDLF